MPPRFGLLEGGSLLSSKFAADALVFVEAGVVDISSSANLLGLIFRPLLLTISVVGALLAVGVFTSVVDEAELMESRFDKEALLPLRPFSC